MKAILILLDSLNRNYLPTYGNSWVKTPNIDRLAARSVVFDNHYLGSAPCMPARRDIITGRLHFLEREWGGLEPFDLPFPRMLSERGVFTHLETDHYHYFEVGGENYHTPFDSWAFHRGQEFDRFVSRMDPIEEPHHLGKWSAIYEHNRRSFHSEKLYPTPKTFAGAAEWLRHNGANDNYFLWVEGFDPHEPFDAPPEYVKLYEDHWDGPLYNWSGYERVGADSEATAHLQRRYAATLTMVDSWLGRLLDEIERQDGFDDTLIVLTTDHGHLLGERGRTGKRLWPVWNELAHLPLIVHLPGDQHAGERRGQLTQNVDIMPTLMEWFGQGFDAPIHGRSWLDILHDDAPSKRQSALYGWFGQSVNVTDARCTYFRGAAGLDNQPLYRYFLMPTVQNAHSLPGPEFFREVEFGHFLPYSPLPVLRSRVDRESLRRHATDGAERDEYDQTMLFDLVDDPGQTRNIAGTPRESHYVDLLREAMREVGAPVEQFERLGIT